MRFALYLGVWLALGGGQKVGHDAADCLQLPAPVARAFWDRVAHTRAPSPDDDGTGVPRGGRWHRRPWCCSLTASRPRSGAGLRTNPWTDAPGELGIDERAFGLSRSAGIREIEHPGELRFLSYLSPGIPRAFFEAVVEHVRQALSQKASLSVESRVSGPTKGTEDPFSRTEADVGFMCTPSFFWLLGHKPPSVELLPAAPVFQDDRAPGLPVYFSELVVRSDNPTRTFLDLRGRSWAYNDPCSLSGYYNLLTKLSEMGMDESFFSQTRCSGSHLNSMEMIVSGEADVAAIGSNVLRIWLQSNPEVRDRLRVIETWGPFPIQPVVVRSGLDSGLKYRLQAALLSIGEAEAALSAFARFGLERFAPVTYEHYASEEAALRKCERALLIRP